MVWSDSCYSPPSLLLSGAAADEFGDAADAVDEGEGEGEEGEEGVQLVYADEATGYRCVWEP